MQRRIANAGQCGNRCVESGEAKVQRWMCSCSHRSTKSPGRRMPVSVWAGGGQHSPAQGPALAFPSRVCPRRRQHLALPVDADIVGVLPARCPIHHSCSSFCVEVEALSQAVEGTGFHTPWERSRGSNDAAKEREERCGEPDLDNSCLTLSLPMPPSCSWPTAQLQMLRRMSLSVPAKQRDPGTLLIDQH